MLYFCFWKVGNSLVADCVKIAIFRRKIECSICSYYLGKPCRQPNSGYQNTGMMQGNQQQQGQTGGQQGGYLQGGGGTQR